MLFKRYGIPPPPPPQWKGPQGAIPNWRIFTEFYTPTTEGDARNNELEGISLKNLAIRKAIFLFWNSHISLGKKIKSPKKKQFISIKDAVVQSWKNVKVWAHALLKNYILRDACTY